MPFPPSPPADDPGPRFLDTERCAARYGFSQEHWRRLVDAGKAPQPRRFGRLVRWATDDLDRWDADGNRPLHTSKRGPRR